MQLHYVALLLDIAIGIDEQHTRYRICCMNLVLKFC